MGFRRERGEDELFRTSRKIRIERIKIDRRGFDWRGKYWGVGAPLFNAYDDETNGDIYTDTFRAADRDAAKAHVRKRHPNARF